MMRRLRLIFAGLLIAGAIALPVRAEVEISLAIKGSAEEIAAVLQFLQTSGLSGGGGLEVQVESSFARPDAPAEPTPPPPPPAPTLALTNPLVAPITVHPGGSTLLSVDVVDTDLKIDTVSAKLGDNALAVDLYDNGMKGDVAAGDGRWSVLLELPADLADGAYTVQINAYDAQGAAIATPGPDGQPVPLTINTTINVSQS